MDTTVKYDQANLLICINLLDNIENDDSSEESCEREDICCEFFD